MIITAFEIGKQIFRIGDIVDVTYLDKNASNVASIKAVGKITHIGDNRHNKDAFNMIILDCSALYGSKVISIMTEDIRDMKFVLGERK